MGLRVLSWCMRCSSPTSSWTVRAPPCVDSIGLRGNVFGRTSRNFVSSPSRRVVEPARIRHKEQCANPTACSTCAPTRIQPNEACPKCSCSQPPMLSYPQAAAKNCWKSTLSARQIPTWPNNDASGSPPRSATSSTTQTTSSPTPTPPSQPPPPQHQSISPTHHLLPNHSPNSNPPAHASSTSSTANPHPPSSNPQLHTLDRATNNLPSRARLRLPHTAPCTTRTRNDDSKTEATEQLRQWVCVLC